MTVIPLPRHGQWAWDCRGEDRAVRVSAHDEAGLLNLSIWRHGTCVGTVRLLPEDVAKLVGGLSEGLAQMAGHAERPAKDASREAQRLREVEQRLAEVESRLTTRTRRRSLPGAGAITAWARGAMGRRSDRPRR